MKFLSIPLILFSFLSVDSNIAQAVCCGPEQTQALKTNLIYAYTWVETNVIDKWPQLEALETSIKKAYHVPNAENITGVFSEAGLTLIDAAKEVETIISAFTNGMTVLKTAAREAENIASNPRATQVEIMRAHARLVNAVEIHGAKVGIRSAQVPILSDQATNTANYQASASDLSVVTEKDLLLEKVEAIKFAIQAAAPPSNIATSSQPVSGSSQRTR